MNEELKIKITAVVDQAKQAIKAVTNELGSFREETDETAASQEQLSQKVKQQSAQLAQLKKEYANIVAAQGKQSAAAINCSRQVSILSASYASNLAALNGASVSNGVFSASALGAAGASEKMGTAANLSSKEFKGFMKAIRESTKSIDTEVEAASAELMNLLNQIEELHDNDLVLFDTEDDFKKLESQVEQVEGAIRDIQDAASDANTKVQKSVKDMADELKDTENQAKETGGAMEKIKSGAAIAGKATVAAFKAAAVAVAGTVVAIGGLAESTREYRTEQAKLTTAFEAAGHSAEDAKTTYNDLYRVLGDSGQATEAAQQLAKLTTNEQELAEWTNICQGVYATFGESLPIESLTEAVNHSAKLGEVQGSLADALEWSGVNVDEFNEQLFWCNTEAEREKLIRTTLNGLYDEAAVGYEENAASIMSANEAQAKLTESLAALGAAVEPIVTIFKAGLAETLAEIVPHMETFAQGLLDVVNGVEGGAERMQEGISGMVTSVIEKITELLPTLLTLGVSIVTAILQGLTENFPAIAETVGQALLQIIAAVGELLPQITGALLAALPLLLDVIFQAAAQIIVLLGEIIPEIVIQIVEILPQIIDSIVKAVPLLMEASITFLSAIVRAIPKIIPPLMAALPQIITSIFELLLNYGPDMMDSSIELLLAIVDAVPEIIPPLIAELPSVIFAILRGLRDAIPQILAVGMSMFMSLVTAIVNVGPMILEALAKILLSIKTGFVNGLKEALKFNIEIPKVKLPKFSVQPAGWQIGDLLKGVIPKLGITWNAKGGVFDSPTLFSHGNSLQGIGEDGAEAVVPLENNLEWLDKLASMLDKRLDAGRNTPIVLQVDGKTFARTVINTVNADTRQKGKLALNIV